MAYQSGNPDLEHGLGLRKCPASDEQSRLWRDTNHVFMVNKQDVIHYQASGGESNGDRCGRLMKELCDNPETKYVAWLWDMICKFSTPGHADFDRFAGTSVFMACIWFPRSPHFVRCCIDHVLIKKVCANWVRCVCFRRLLWGFQYSSLACCASRGFWPWLLTVSPLEVGKWSDMNDTGHAWPKPLPPAIPISI